MCRTEEISFHSKNNSGLILLSVHCKLGVIVLKYLGWYREKNIMLGRKLI